MFIQRTEHDLLRTHIQFNYVFTGIFFRVTTIIINNLEKKSLGQCNYETAKTVIVSVEVLSLHLHFQNNLFWADLCPAKKKKSPPQLSQFFSYSESKLSKFSFALRP